MKWFLVDHDNNVLGVVLWDPAESTWEPSPGYRLCPTSDGFWRDGWKWDDSTQTAFDPNPPPLPPPEEEPHVVT